MTDNYENAAIAVRKNGKWYVGGGSGETNILTYDSLDEVPEDLAEGSFVAVPSTESGGGLKVVELSTVPTSEGAALSEDENAAMNTAYAKGLPVAVKFDNSNENMTILACMTFGWSSVTMNNATTRMFSYSDVQASVNYILMSADGDTWVFMTT